MAQSDDGIFYTILEIFEEFVSTWEICLYHNHSETQDHNNQICPLNEAPLKKCKMNLIKQIESKLKTKPSPSQSSFKMITASFARAWNSCEVFNGLTPLCSFIGGARVTLSAQCPGFPSSMLTMQPSVHKRECFSEHSGSTPAPSWLLCQNRNITLSFLLLIKV